MKTVIFALLASCVCAQPAKLPNWAGVGSEYSSSTAPHFTGWAAIALPIVSSEQLYSYSMYQTIPSTGKVPTVSTTTGLATILRTFPIPKRGAIYLMGLATAGAANTGTATTGAFAGGGMLVWRKPSGLTFEIGALQTKAGSTAKPLVLGGIGWAW